MITSLLQVVNAGLMQVFHQLAASLKISSCSKSDVHLMKLTGLIQLVGKLHQAGKM
jgi:hypothetical protein